MKNPDTPSSSEHPGALLLPYVEDLISPSERAGVEEHLSRCRECASRVQDLKQMVADLKQNKQAFCPEPWELHDFARSGDDPHGIISTHVENCPFCSENLTAWRRAESEERVPAKLWGRLRELLPGAAHEHISHEEPKWSQTVLDKLVRFWKAPALAAGAAVAMLLLIVIFYQSPTEPIVPIPKSLPQKTAFVVLVKDFKNPLLQKQIESVSEALSASSELKERYTIVPRSETSKVIERGKAPLDDRSAMIEGLKKNLNVSRVLVVTVFPSADKPTARIDLIDTVSRKTLQTKTVENIEPSELPVRVRSDALSMLLSPTN